MATLKGQNLRVFIQTISGPSVMPLATNCVITLNNETEENNTKDDVSAASKPTVANKSWSVQVDSLSPDAIQLALYLMKVKVPILVIWDETDTLDNQTPVYSDFARGGQAYISDITLNMNNRELASGSATFTGTGPIANPGEFDFTLPATFLPKYGQFFRLVILETAVIAAARQLQFHASMTMENITTKDTESEWQVMAPDQMSYEITTNALVRSDETIDSDVPGFNLFVIEDIYEHNGEFEWAIYSTSGDNNRDADVLLISGEAVITQLQMNGPNRQSATYQATLAGVGEFEVEIT